ncbi:MAG: flippase-like domain-containing protein [Magnetovibrionaceae bacterium]
MAIKPFLIATGLAGVAGFTGVVAWVGAGEIWQALSQAGPGILLVAAFHLIPLGLDALSWWALLKHHDQRSALWALKLRWIGQSVNGLLPAAQVGGDVLRVRLSIADGVKASLATASVVADLTLAVLTQAVYSALGVLALLALGLSLGDGLLGPLALGLVLFASVGGLFIALQNADLLAKVARFAEALLGSKKDWSAKAEAVDQSLKTIYADRNALAEALLWRMGGWITGTGEVWIGLWLLDHPISLGEAFMIEALIQAVRSAAFIIPGALGIQEIALVVLGGTAGIGPETALALSLIKRARELLVGLPGLLTWQVWEARRLRA